MRWSQNGRSCLIGYRLWTVKHQIINDQHIFRLSSNIINTIWPAGKMKAECIFPLYKHRTIPDKDCSCGIYAYKYKNNTPDTEFTPLKMELCGKVILNNKSILTNNIYRSQSAIVTEIYREQKNAGKNKIECKLCRTYHNCNNDLGLKANCAVIRGTPFQDELFEQLSSFYKCKVVNI